MEQAESGERGPRNISIFVHILFAGSLLLAVFVVGFFVGKSQAPKQVEVSFSVPDGLELKGLSNEKVGCLEWVSNNFKDVTAGTLSLICNGRPP